MRRARRRPDDGVGHVVRAERLHPRIDALRLLLVAEADDRELGLRQPRVDLGDPDVGAAQLQPQRLGDHPHPVLGGRVHRATLVDAARGVRAEVDHVAAPGRDHPRQEPARHPHQADHVGLHHPEQVLVLHPGEIVPAEREARVVEEDLRRPGAGAEGLDALLGADVERARLGLRRAGLLAAPGHLHEPLHAPRAEVEGMPEAREPERGGRAESRARAGDHHQPRPAHSALTSTVSGSSRLPSALDR